jgi:DNA-binding transcriptional regulator PaaX
MREEDIEEKPFYRTKFNYKGIEVNSFGIPTFLLGNKKKNRIKSQKRKRNFYNTNFHSPFNKSSPKNLIVMYDIPSDKKRERDWFRRQLKKFEFIMIQKSVWVGPSPLPKEFLEYVKEIKIGDDFKTFKLEKPYNFKSKGQ